MNESTIIKHDIAPPFKKILKNTHSWAQRLLFSTNNLITWTKKDTGAKDNSGKTDSNADTVFPRLSWDSHILFNFTIWDPQSKVTLSHPGVNIDFFITLPLEHYLLAWSRNDWNKSSELPKQGDMIHQCWETWRCCSLWRVWAQTYSVS